MKKRVLSIISFILVFVLLFMLFQGMFKQKWEGRAYRAEDYKNLSDEEVDILALGTSELWACYDPIVTYHEQGITGYNLTTPFNSAITAYYQLCQQLEYHTPKYVICDFAALFEDGLPRDDGSIENLFCETFDILKDPKLKLQLMRDVTELDDTKNPVEWLFPLVRYHSMWNSLSKDNFDLNHSPEPYRKGARLESTYYRSRMYDVKPEDWQYEEEMTEMSEISVKFYDKFIEKCHEKDIIVIAVIPPAYSYAANYAAGLNTKAQYLYSRGVYLLNYNTYEQLERMNVDLERDHYDFLHLNTLGSVKFSKILANDLKTYFEIPDRRNNEKIAEKWDAEYEQFVIDMLNSQPTIRITVDLAAEFGYNAILDVGSNTDNIWSGELMELNAEYNYFEKIRPGYYIYDGHNQSVEYFEYDWQSQEGTVNTSFGEIKREVYGDDYAVHVSLNNVDLYSEPKAVYMQNVASPMFLSKLAIFDNTGKVYSETTWHYDAENGNSQHGEE